MDQNPGRTVLRPFLRVGAWGQQCSQAGSVAADGVPSGGDCGEELVGLSGGFGEVSVVGVEVALGGLDLLVSEDLLEHVQGDAGVGHPGCSGVSQPVTGEVTEAELLHEVVPVGSRRGQCR